MRYLKMWKSLEHQQEIVAGINKITRKRNQRRGKEIVRKSK